MDVGRSNGEQTATSIVIERARYFQTNRWSAPVGFAAAVGFYSVLISPTSMSPGPLRWWAFGMLFFVALQVVAFTVPSVAARVDDFGAPILATVSSGMVGIGFGSLLWIDLDASRAADVRWITLAFLFAVSAGVVAGISGVNHLGNALFIPMWVGTSGALVFVGSYTTAGACAFFALICFKDQYSSGELWNELMELRVESHDIAEANHWAATHDPMTSLVNRSGFMDLLHKRAEVSDSLITVMFVDLDRFKEVNDNHGHAAGDHLLAEAADRITGAIRASDTVGRFGGDEFCVLLDEQADEAGADRVAHEIIKVLEQPFTGPWGLEAIEISASIGVASITPAEATPERLILDADFAMYEAKRLGRRRVVHFGRELEAELSARLGLKADFRRLIGDELLEADAQPIFNLGTGRVSGVEMLARWRLPDGTTVPPDIFIPLAEELGLIGQVTRLMLRAAGERLQAWTGHPELGTTRVSVNVSGSDLASGVLVAEVAEVMNEFDIGPDRLVLELTESLDIAGSVSDLAQFEALRLLGVEIAIDDFGTGYSSLDSLLSFPVDFVKLDASLIANLGDDPRQTVLMRRITELAAVIGRTVVVEGVETAVQLAELSRLDITHVQGYHLCRPVPAHSLADRLHQLRNDADSPLSNTLSRR